MRISIFGLGYVGTVSAGCFANDGNQVIGVDPVKTKVDLISKGKTPIIERDIGEMISANVKKRLLRATTDVNEAVAGSDVSLVCVGTPSQPNGNLDLTYVRRTCEEIGRALKKKTARHVVVLRSTIIPGTMKSLVIPLIEEASGKKAGGPKLGICNNPEFLREGSAVYDFYHPARTVIGETDSASGDVVASLYEKIPAPIIRTEIEVAEAVKYVDNSWHAVKVAFTNEIGKVCKKSGIDSHKVMEIFCLDDKLNLSPYYMKPGFAFGGSCLPKDVRALAYKARSVDLDLPLLNSILASNQRQIEMGLQMIYEKGNKKIGILGFSFKEGTDDLRESPIVEVIERLMGKGYDIRIYDRNVNIASLVGANKDYILNHIPHISKLMVKTMAEVMAHGSTIVIGNKDPEFAGVLKRLKKGQTVVDLVRIVADVPRDGNYDGVCW